MEKILVSACLLGCACRYDGKSAGNENVISLNKRYTLIPVCPEIYGGLATPRDPAELKDGRVVTKAGVDVTKAYQKGARETARMADLYDCHTAILKEKSPSCGCGKVYDGSFSRVLVEGDGVTASKLKELGLTIIGESQLDRFLK